MRWVIELSEFDVQYEPRGPIKGQVYADFVVELSSAATHQEGTGSEGCSLLMVPPTNKVVGLVSSWKDQMGC